MTGINKCAGVKFRICAQRSQDVGVVFSDRFFGTNFDKATEVIVIDPFQQVVFVLKVPVKAAAADAGVLEDLIDRDLLDRSR